MILGMSLATFTQFHVIISLIGIVSGIVVVLGMLGANRLPGTTALFLIATVATSVTGFMFPTLILFIGLGVAAFKKFRPMTRAPAIA
jgi:hypothetical protein